MERLNHVSAFDMLRERMMMPDLWIHAEQPAASKREIARRKINRILRGVLERIGLSSLRTRVSTRANEFGIKR